MSSTPGPAPSRRDPADAAAVEAVVRSYIDAWHTGDAQRMGHSLHDDLVKRTVGGEAGTSGHLTPVSKAQMVDLTRAGGGRSPDAPADVVVHHLEGDVASAHVATAQYLDYLHLARTDGTWRIVHDLFHERG